MIKPPTPTELRYLNTIQQFQKENSYIPTGVELAEELSLTHQAIYVMLRKLERKGWIIKEHNKLSNLTLKALKFVNL